MTNGNWRRNMARNWINELVNSGELPPEYAEEKQDVYAGSEAVLAKSGGNMPIGNTALSTIKSFPIPSLKVEEKYEMPFDDESSYQEELKKCRKTVNVFSTI